MALGTDVQTRFPAQLLVNLTNQDNAAATTLNATVLNAAVADAEAEFRLLTGVTFDPADAAHVQAAVPGVLYHLHLYSGVQTEALARWRTRFDNACDQLTRSVGNRARIRPQTTSVLLPSDELADARPDHDRSHWADLVPRLAPSDETDPDTVGGA